MSDNLNLVIRGGSSVSLTRSHYVAEGGCGKVYIKGKIAYKVGDIVPLGKIEEFRALSSNRNIVIPQNELQTKNGDPAGITMDAIDPLCTWETLCTEDSRTDHGIDDAMLMDYCNQLMETAHYIHPKNFLIVDANTLNFLISSDKQNVLSIDVNSWKTPSYKATAVNPLIQDYLAMKSKGSGEYYDVNKLTDFYSLGILVFMAWANMHPYRGNHPDFKGFKANQKLEKIRARCEKHVSVFNKDATYAPCCDLDRLPNAFRNWAYETYELGKRSTPPKDLEKAQIVPKPIQKKKVVVSGISVESYTPLKEFSHVEYDGEKLILKDNPSETCNLDYIHRSDNHWYGVGSGKYCKIELFQHKMFLNKPVSTFLDLPYATQQFDGCLYQDMVGNAYFYCGGKQIHYSDLDGKKVLDAKYKLGVLCVAYVDGANKKLVFYKGIQKLYEYSDVQFFKPNFAVLDTGIIIAKIESQLHAFSPKASTVKVIDTTLDNVVLGEESNKFLFVDTNGKWFRGKLNV